MKSLPLHTLIDQLWRKLRIDQLEPREKIVLTGGAIFVLCFLILQLIVSPYFSARKQHQRAIANNQAALLEMQLLQQEFNTLNQQRRDILDRLAKRNKGFTLFTFLDSQAEKAGVKNRIAYMKPSSEPGDGPLSKNMVEMKLQEVTLQEIVEFLQLVESPQAVVFLQRFSLQSGNNQQGYLDVIMQVVTFREGQ